MRFLTFFFCATAITAMVRAQAPAPAEPVTSQTGGPTELEEELLVIKATPYKPTLGRDPFSAPSEDDNASQGDRIDDIAVKGRIISNGKVLAVVSDSRGNVKWLPVGYKFKDGILTQITDKAVVFQQREAGVTSGVSKTVVKPFKLEGGK